MRKGFFPRLALSGIHKNRKIYYPYILTAVLTTAMMYMIGSLEGASVSYSGTLAFSLQLGIVVTSVFSVVFLFYTNSFLMKRRKKEFGLYNILGMEKKHLARLILWETAAMLLISLALGFGMGILLDKLMHLLLGRMVGRYTPMEFYVSAGSMRYTALLIGVTFGLIFLNSVRQVYSAKPVELLRGGEVGEREPKSKWIMTLLGLAALGAGYWISATVKDAGTMIVFFFFAVLLVIAGTYLLFTAGSITALKVLKRNRRYYYKPDHFISVSGMMYRMKQNAVGLANVCILSTMVLVMIFATVSLWFGMEDTLNLRIAGDIEFESQDQDIAALYASVDEALKEAGLERENSLAYRYVAFTAYRSGHAFLTGDQTEQAVNLLTDSPSNIYVIPLEDYNRMFGLDEALAPDEVLLECYRGEYEGDTLTVLDETFRVKKRVQSRLGAADAIASMYSSYYLIVDGMETMERLNEKQRVVYRDRASAVRTSVGFELTGTEEQKRAAAETLERHLENTRDLRFFNSRLEMKNELLELYGGLLFVGLFLGALFTMAMILIIYYKQISEGYDDRERYRIMRKVGLSKREIKRSISSQILIVFFLPLAAAGLHVAFAFPGIVTMFRALAMTNVPLIATCALACFVVFALIYGAVYLLTAKVYYRIVSE